MMNNTFTVAPDVNIRQIQEMLNCDPSVAKLYDQLGSSVRKLSLMELKYVINKRLIAAGEQVAEPTQLDFREFIEYVIAPFHSQMGELYDLHEEWVNVIEIEYPDSNVLFYAPINSWKSTVLGVNYPLFMIYKTNGLIRIGNFSAGEDLPKKRVAQCREVIENNERIQALGVKKPTRVSDWGEKSFTVDRHGAVLYGSTMKAFGVMGETQGTKFDLGILDDIVSERNSRTETNRKNLREKFNREVLSRLTDDPPYPMKASRFVDVCTSYHKDDLNAELGRGFEGCSAASFVVRRYKALYEEDEIKEAPRYIQEQIKKGKYIVVDPTTGSKRAIGLAFPENKQLSYKGLMKIKATRGTRFYVQNYQQIPISDEDRLVQPEWIEQCYSPNLVMGASLWAKYFRSRGYKLLFVADPAVARDKRTAEKKNRDYWVFIAWAYSRSEDMRVLLDFRRGRGARKSNLISIARDFYDTFVADGHLDSNPVWFVEDNAAQDFLVQDFEAEFGRTYVKGLSTTMISKHEGFTGLPAVSYVFETKSMIIPTGDKHSSTFAKILFDEAVNYGQGGHDDVVSCCLLLEQAIKNLRGVVKDLDPAIFGIKTRRGRSFPTIATPSQRYRARYG